MSVPHKFTVSKASLVAQVVKNPPAMQETWVPSLSQEDLLEEGMATHSSILAWRIPWTKRILAGPTLQYKGLGFSCFVFGLQDLCSPARG